MTTIATKRAHWREGTQQHQNERMQWGASNICCKKCALKRRNTRIENESNVQWGATSCCYKKCTLKKRNVRTINWKQCNTQMTRIVAKNAHKKERRREAHLDK